MRSTHQHGFPLRLAPPDGSEFCRNDRKSRFPETGPARHLFVCACALGFPPAEGIGKNRTAFGRREEPDVRSGPQNLMRSGLPADRAGSFRPQRRRVIHSFAERTTTSQFPGILHAPHNRSGLCFRRDSSERLTPRTQKTSWSISRKSKPASCLSPKDIS